MAVAFALAAYGRVETDYLVSRIDDIGTANTANFVDALAVDRARALAALKTAADQCAAESLWRRKAKLAVAALAAERECRTIVLNCSGVSIVASN